MDMKDINGGLINNKRFSPFDDTAKNLVILADSESGTLALCHQEYFVSKKKEKGHDVNLKSVNKFIVSFQPRLLLVPSIDEEVGPVLDYALVRSPA